MVFQPRFIAFAKAHGKTPEQMQEQQTSNVPFMIWISSKLDEYRTANPDGFAGRTLLDHDGFTAFLLND